MDENYLRHIQLVEHIIDSNDPKPIKQPPKHLLMVLADEDHKLSKA